MYPYDWVVSSQWFISSQASRQQVLRGGGAVAYLLVSQQRHATLREPAYLFWTQRMFGQTLRLGGGVGVEGGLADVRVSEPEAEGDDLVRAGLARDRVRARPLWGTSAGKAGDGEVEAVPEELDGAGLAVEAPG
jgi:hypothetical protein